MPSSGSRRRMGTKRKGLYETGGSCSGRQDLRLDLAEPEDSHWRRPVSETPARVLAASRGLISTPATENGSNLQAHLLEQYKLYVEQASKISERRTSANTFLLTVNTSLLALYGLASTAVAHRAESWYFFLPLAGVVLCITWWSLLRSYRDLN